MRTACFPVLLRPVACLRDALRNVPAVLEFLPFGAGKRAVFAELRPGSLLLYVSACHAGRRARTASRSGAMESRAACIAEHPRGWRREDWGASAGFSSAVAGAL